MLNEVQLSLRPSVHRVEGPEGAAFGSAVLWEGPHLFTITYHLASRIAASRVQLLLGFLGFVQKNSTRPALTLFLFVKYSWPQPISCST